jgi:hypothetical protein
MLTEMFLGARGRGVLEKRKTADLRHDRTWWRHCDSDVDKRATGNDRTAAPSHNCPGHLWSTPMSMTFITACHSRDMSTKACAIVWVNMPAMTIAMAFVRSMSTPWKASRCYGDRSRVRIGASRRRTFPLSLGFFAFLHNVRRRG